MTCRIIRMIAISAGLLTILSFGCKSFKRSAAPSPPLSKCMEDLGAIPESRVALKTRKQDNEPETEGLKGAEIALTINGMISSRIDPSADLDDWCYTENTRENFEKLVTALKERQLPPTVAFAVGNRMEGEFWDDWLGSGNLVGNMTYERPKLKKVTAHQYEQDIARCEISLAPLLQKTHQSRHYFRYPDSRGNREPDERLEVTAYLKDNGYAEVPFTIDAQDDQFSQVYCSALARGDQSCANLVKVVYKSTLLAKTAAARIAARRFAGTDIPQVLVMRANELTCDLLGEILDLYKAAGVRFIPIDLALSNSAYQREDAWDM